MGWRSTVIQAAGTSEVEWKREAEAARKEEQKGKRTLRHPPPPALDKATWAWTVVMIGAYALSTVSVVTAR
jgi:hypothetical protein